MADYIKKIRISSGEEMQIDYDALANLPTAKYSTEEQSKLEGIEEGANKTVIADNLNTDDSTQALSARQGKVLNERSINGKVLNTNITLSASDVGAAPTEHSHNTLVIASGNYGDNLPGTGVNGQVFFLRKVT